MDNLIFTIPLPVKIQPSFYEIQDVSKMDQTSCAHCMKSGAVDAQIWLTQILCVNQTVFPLKLNTMHCVICCFSKLVPKLTPYILTQYEYKNNTCHAESYDIHKKLCEAGG